MRFWTLALSEYPAFHLRSFLHCAPCLGHFALIDGIFGVQNLTRLQRLGFSAQWIKLLVYFWAGCMPSKPYMKYHAWRKCMIINCQVILLSCFIDSSNTKTDIQICLKYIYIHTIISICQNSTWVKCKFWKLATQTRNQQWKAPAERTSYPHRTLQSSPQGGHAIRPRWLPEAVVPDRWSCLNAMG